MSASDILKAALAKKKALNQKIGQKNSNENNKSLGETQVVVHRPTKKAAGRGR